MNNRYFKQSILVICLCSLLIVPGCWSRKELSEISFVIGASIDKNHEGKGVKVITQTARVDILATSGKSDTPAFVNYENTGKTVFDAIRNITLEEPLRLFWGHQQVLLVSEELAKENFIEAINFFARDHETSRHVMLAIIEGDPEAFMYTQTSKQDIPTKGLRSILKGYKVNGKTIPVEIHDYLRTNATPGICNVVPLVRMQVKNGVPHHEVSGTAIFSEDILVGKLTAEETRGLSWLLNLVDSAVITVNVTQAAKEHAEDFVVDEVALETLNAKTEIKALGNQQFEVNTEVEVSIGEESLKESFSRQEYNKLTEMIKEQAAKAIEEEMREVVAITKELRADSAGFGRALYRQYPDEWKNLKDDWCTKHYPDINIKYNIAVNVIGSMLIREIDSH